MPADCRGRDPFLEQIFVGGEFLRAAVTWRPGLRLIDHPDAAAAMRGLDGKPPAERSQIGWRGNPVLLKAAK